MKKLSLNLFTVALVAGTIGLTSCGNDAASNDNNNATEETTNDDSAADATSDDAATVTIELNSTDQMTFDQTELRVPAGSKVKFTLHHTGKMPVTAMGHNFVLLNQGVDLEEFSKSAIGAKDNDYIPADADIIAHTRLIGGGESDEITFDAPAAGEYDFLCSFPGHHAMMKGKFIVE